MIRSMLVSTDLLNETERREALAATPWCEEVERLAGYLRASLDKGAVDLIEATIGPSHARGALVALYEGTDVLLQATMDIAESVARQRYFARVVPLKPLGRPDPLDDAGRNRFPNRLARFALEDAAVKVVTAGDHLVNATLRFAWEANAALLEEVQACGFDPTETSPRWWADLTAATRGLEKLRRQNSLGPLTDFRLTAALERFAGVEAVSECRDFRHQTIHGERPSYKETAAFGRSTLWTGPRVTLTFPPAPDLTAPSLDDTRRMIGDAAEATLAYAEASWAFAREWLRSVQVWITVSDPEVRIQTNPLSPRFKKRENRDPGPFLAFGERSPA